MFAACSPLLILLLGLIVLIALATCITVWAGKDLGQADDQEVEYRTADKAAIARDVAHLRRQVPDVPPPRHHTGA